MPIGGLGSGAVQGALEGLARSMQIVRSPVEMRKDAALVQRVTEGVPELVQQSLQWIQAEQWLDIERLDEPQFFEKIIAPYIRDRILDRDSLLPGKAGRPEDQARQLEALHWTLRALVPYRFITLNHVTHHLDIDLSFRDALNETGWQAEDIWQAVVGLTALLRPLDEPWREIHPAVRRLLYRYFYPWHERAEAHRSAGQFMTYWAGQVIGKEQVMGVVEAIWHEAARLRLNGTAAMGEELIRFAASLSLDTRSPGYTEAELRDCAAQLMEEDDELQREVTGIESLFEKLIMAVRYPTAEEA